MLKVKKQAYEGYRKIKNEAQEMMIAKRNIASLYEAEAENIAENSVQKCQQEEQDR